jgi:hypothetical protein
MTDEAGGKPGWLKPTWYQTLVAFSGLLLLVLAHKELWNAALATGGFFLVGIGEWINHPRRIGVLPGLRALKGWISSRSPHWLGWTFDVLGAILLVIGILRLLRHW